MKKVLLSAAVIFSLVMADYGILQHLRPFGIKIELLIVALIFFNLSYRPNFSFTLIISAGILKDILSTSVFGLYTLSFAMAGVLMNYLKKWVVREGFWVEMFYGFLITLFILSSMEILEHVFKFGFLDTRIIFLQSILPGSMINALLTPICLRILSKFLR